MFCQRILFLQVFHQRIPSISFLTKCTRKGTTTAPCHRSRFWGTPCEHHCPMGSKFSKSIWNERCLCMRSKDKQMCHILEVVRVNSPWYPQLQIWNLLGVYSAPFSWSQRKKKLSQWSFEYHYKEMGQGTYEGAATHVEENTKVTRTLIR